MADIVLTVEYQGGDSQDELTQLRRAIANVNETVAQNRNALVGATAEERKNIRALNEANNAQKALLRSRVEQLTIQKQAIAQTAREARARERAAEAAEKAAQRTRAAQQQAVAELSAGATVVARGLADITGGFITAAANMETFRNSIQAVTGDAAETDQVLQRLLDLTIELVGIDTGDLIQFSARLMAAGLSADDTITSIRGVTERVAEQGKSAEVTARVLEQLTQAINSNSISAQDFKPILREIPTFFTDASNALGVTITSLEDFRNATDAAGGPTQAIIALLGEMARASEGADLSSANAQLEIFNDQMFVLRSELGEHLLPALVTILRQINDWIEAFNNLDDEAQSAIAWTAAIATGVTALAGVVGTAVTVFGQFSGAISTLLGTGGGIGGLTNLLGGATNAFKALTGPVGLVTTTFTTLISAWRQIYTDFGRTPPFEDAVESIKELDLASSQTAKSLGITSETLQGVTAESATEVTNLVSRLDELRRNIVILINSSGDNREALQGLRAEYQQLLPQLEMTIANLEKLPPTTDAATESTQNFGLELAKLDAIAQDAATRLENTESFDQLGANYRNAIQASDAYYDALIAGAERALAEEKAGSEEAQQIETELFELRRERAQAHEKLTSEVAEHGAAEAKRRVDAQAAEEERLLAIEEESFRARRAQREEDSEEQKQQAQEEEERRERQTELRIEQAERAREAEVEGFQRAAEAGEAAAERIREQIEEEAEARERQAEARIEIAERAREAEVEGFERAAESGGSYAEQLAEIEDLAQRQAFVDFVNNLVDQGVAFDDARERAAEYFTEIEREIRELARRNYGELIAVIKDASTETAVLEAAFATLGDRAANDIGRITSAFSPLLDQLGDAGDELANFGDLLGNIFSGDFLAAAGNVLDIVLPGLTDPQHIQDLGPQLRNLSLGEIQANQDLGINLDNFTIGDFGNFNIQPIDFSGVAESIVNAFSIEDLEAAMQRAGENFSEAIENTLSPAEIESNFQDYIESINSFFDAQIQLVDAAERASVEAARATTLNAARQAQASDRPNFQAISRQQGNRARRSSAAADAPVSDLYAQYQADVDAATATVDTDALAEVVASIQDQVATINASILNINTQISQTSEPSEIAGLLDQIPALITQKYQRLRDALNEQYTAGELTDEAYSAAFSELESNETAEIEAHSDQVLANTLMALSADAALINASITGINTQIAGLSEPSEIATLLDQIPALISQKYQNLREALNEQYAAGEISDAAYSASFAQLASAETADIEANSDAMLANTIQAINDDVGLIDASITGINTQIDALSEPEAIAELLAEIPALITSKYQNLREALEAQYAAGEISEDVYNASLSALNSSEAGEIEQNSDAMLANTLQAINEDVALIDSEITSLNTQIDALSEPEAIAELLAEIPALITEKYGLLRQALEEQYAAGEISQDTFNASFSELNSSEAGEIEAHSDQVLAIVIQMIDEDVSLIDASISEINTQIDALSEPEEIATLLDQIPALIREKYRLLREGLEAQYAEGEISADTFNASISGLNSSEAGEIEANSDAVLANTIQAINEDVGLIDAQIGALQLTIEQSDDPEVIAGLLDSIRLLIGDKYRQLREALEAQFAAEEISADTFNAGITALNTAEQTALTGLDTQALNALTENYRDQVDFINGGIENLRLSIQATDDPAEIQQILDAIGILTQKRFQVLRDELEAVADSLSPEEFQQALEGINLAEQVALDSLDTEKLSVISEEAQNQVNLINGSIENLRLAFELTDDPAEQQQILDAIKILVASRFDVLRDELEAIRETLSPEEYEQALTGLNLSEQLSIDNLDTEQFNIISEEARKQIDFINGSIENLRLSIQLTDDPAEIEAILDAIKTLVAARFRILRDELEAVRETLSPEEFQAAWDGLNLGERLALDNLDTRRFSAISDAAQKQVDFINGAIANLELSLQVTDDPAEIEQILNSIKILVSARFDILIQELKALEESLDPAEFSQALEGLELGRAVALRGIDDQLIDNVQTQTETVNTALEELFEELGNETTAEGLTTAVNNVREQIITNNQNLRDKINALSISEEQKAEQIAEIDIQEVEDLSRLSEASIEGFKSLNDTALFLLENATPENFESRQQEAIDAINRFFDEQIAFINGLDLPETDRANMREVAETSRRIALEAIPEMHESVAERLELEMELAEKITEIRRKAADAAAEVERNLARQQRDIQTKLSQDRERIQRDAAEKRRNIEAELANDIREIENALAAELVQISARFAIERQNIEIKLQNDIAQINMRLANTIADIEKDAAERRRDINTELNREITQIQQEAARERRDITTELNRDIEQAERDHIREIEDINRELARELEQIQVDLMRSEVEIREDTIRELRDIDAEYAREQEEAARELSQELEDIERDRLQSIEDANREHQQNLVDISRGATEDIEDINIDLSRRLSDIDSRLQRQLANLTGTRRERGERAIELRLRAEQDRQDARIRASRDIEDVQRERLRDENEARIDLGRDTDEIGRDAQADEGEAREEARREQEEAAIQQRNDIEDARQEERDDLIDAREEARQDEADARVSTRQDIEDAGIEKREDIADAREEARQDISDSRLEEREDIQDAREEARQDLADSELDERERIQEAREDARQDKEDAREEARQRLADNQQQERLALERAELEAREAIAKAELEARQELEKVEQQERLALERAELEARQALEKVELRAREKLKDIRQDERERIRDIGLEERDDLIDAREEARQDEADARVSTRQDIEDAGIEKREDIADAREEARQDISDSRLEEREDIQDAREEARQDLADSELDERERIRDIGLEEREGIQDGNLEKREEIQDTKNEMRESTRDTREEARQSQISAQHAQRLAGESEHTNQLFLREHGFIKVLEQLQEAGLKNRLRIHADGLQGIYNELTREIIRELHVVRAISNLARGTITATEAAGMRANEAAIRADQAATETIAALNAFNARTQGGGQMSGSSGSSSSSSSTQTIIVNSNIELDGESVGSNSQVVRAVTNRQTQLDTQGVINR